MALISAFAYILSSLAFSTFRILPLSGRMACVARLLAVLAEPPAESPSTMYISHLEGSLSIQSASLPGRDIPSSADFLLVSSLAFLAASLARWESTDFSMIVFATAGFCSRKISSWPLTTLSTAPLASLFPSFCFVCPSNCGSSILTLIMAVSPSRISSPERFDSLSFKILFFLAYSLKVLVRAFLNPTIWVPPSGVVILFTKP